MQTQPIPPTPVYEIETQTELKIRVIENPVKTTPVQTEAIGKVIKREIGVNTHDPVRRVENTDYKMNV